MTATMTTDATPDFRLYPSNVLELLAALLAEELRTPVPGQSPLAPDVVLIPQVAMRRWLQATLAAKYGVAANLKFLTPGEFVARALDANLGPSTDDLDMAALQWRLYGVLNDPALRTAPALAPLDAWLDDGDPLKPWSLAGELAGVYEKYQGVAPRLAAAVGSGRRPGRRAGTAVARGGQRARLPRAPHPRLPRAIRP